MANIDSTAHTFIGKGLTFPIQLVNGRPPIDSGKKLIESSLRDILAWVLGTRFFLGEYGGKTEFLLQEPNDGISAALLKFYSIALIKFWEKRVENVGVKVLKRDQGVMLIQLTYRITNSQITGSFVYPYYSQLIY